MSDTPSQRSAQGARVALSVAMMLAAAACSAPAGDEERISSVQSQQIIDMLRDAAGTKLQDLTLAHNYESTRAND